MKKIRKSVLKSFLFICLGLTVTTIVFAGVKSVATPPDPPGKPSAREVTTTGCLLEYKAPRNDGGLPVKSYVIECMILTWGWDRWELKGTSPELEYAVSYMVEGSKAIFRVRAENRAGVGQPSKESDEITFEDPF